MELYIKVMFWMWFTSLTIRIITMSCREWPHTSTETLGQYVAGSFLTMAFMIWAAIVIWGK